MDNKICCGGEITQDLLARYPRVNRLLENFFEMCPQFCIERAEIYTKAFRETEGKRKS